MMTPHRDPPSAAQTRSQGSGHPQVLSVAWVEPVSQPGPQAPAIEKSSCNFTSLVSITWVPKKSDWP